MLMQALALGCDIGRPLEADLQSRRFEGCEDYFAHPCVERGPGEGLADGAAILPHLARTAVAQSRPVVVLGRRHAEPTPAADHQSRQPRGPIPNHPAPRLGIRLELTPIALPLLPTNRGGEAIWQEDLPVLWLDHQAPRGGTTRLFAFGISGAATIRIGASVDGMRPEIAQCRAMGPAPPQLALAGPEAPALGHAALMLPSLT